MASASLAVKIKLLVCSVLPRDIQLLHDFMDVDVKLCQRLSYLLLEFFVIKCEERIENFLVKCLFLVVFERLRPFWRDLPINCFNLGGVWFECDGFPWHFAHHLFNASLVLCHGSISSLLESSLPAFSLASS